MTKLALVSIVEPSREIEAHMPPLGLAYVASYLRKYMDFHDTRVFSIDKVSDLKGYSPDIVGISSVTQNFTKATLFARDVKAQLGDVPVIVGGPHITALPHTLPEPFDAGILGEGEQTFLELLGAFLRRGKLDGDALGKIQGIAYRDGRHVVSRGPRELIRPLDMIPMPARDLIKVDAKTQMMTSRGCPYHCVFCSSSAFWQTTRFFSAKYVIEEIKDLVYKYNVRTIHFYDDLFIADKKRLNEISRLVREEKMHEKVTFACNCRANLIDDETCKVLSDMNVRYASFGFETGSERMLSYLKCGQVTVEQNRRAVETCTTHGINVCGTFIVGIPGESKDDMMKTLEFIKRNRICGSSDVYVLTPYPGTVIWDYAIGRGIVSNDMEDWGGLGLDFDPKRSILLNDAMSMNEFSRLYFEIKNEIERHKTYDVISSIKSGLTHPRRAIGFLSSKLRGLARNFRSP